MSEPTPSEQRHEDGVRRLGAAPRPRQTRWDREADSAPDIRANVESFGSGPPVAFLHGLLGLNRHWMRTVEPLSRTHRCLLLEAPLLELRGAKCSVEGVEEVMRRELEGALDRPAVLVGNSLGGHLAMRLAINSPDLVRGLVLTGSSGLFERTFERDVRHRASRDWLRKKIEELFADPSRMPEEAVDHAYDALRKRGSARALVRLSRSAKSDHMGSRMPEISVPTLLLWGRKDVVTPPHVAEEFAELIPGAELRWIDDCGHAPMLECPKALSDGIAAFLKRLDKQEAGGVSSRQEVA